MFAHAGFYTCVRGEAFEEALGASWVGEVREWEDAMEGVG